MALPIEHLFARAVSLLRLYLQTADSGPRGRRGVPELWTLDEKARALLADVAEFDKERSA